MLLFLSIKIIFNFFISSFLQCVEYMCCFLGFIIPNLFTNFSIYNKLFQLFSWGYWWVSQGSLNHWSTSWTLLNIYLKLGLTVLPKALLTCWGWLWTHDPPVSASQATGITHHMWTTKTVGSTFFDDVYKVIICHQMLMFHKVITHWGKTMDCILVIISNLLVNVSKIYNNY